MRMNHFLCFFSVSVLINVQSIEENQSDVRNMFPLSLAWKRRSLTSFSVPMTSRRIQNAFLPDLLSILQHR